MGDAAKKWANGICRKLFRGEEVRKEAIEQLHKVLEGEGIKMGTPIPWVLCERCGQPIYRSEYWIVACLRSGNAKGCGLKP